MRVGHAGSVLGRLRVKSRRLRDGVEGHGLVLGIPDFIEVHMRNLLVLDDGWVVRGGVPRQLGEVL